MQIILMTLLMLSCLVTAGGILILVIISPKPTRPAEHLLGIGRYTVFGGVVYTFVETAIGELPPWPTIVIVMGLAIQIGTYARDQHLIAKWKERTERPKVVAVESETESGV